ncbi:MAG: transporter substrate-binding domain-containing protein [Oceanospirillaceae bacterium]|nr:transporter substrate-binding domain-containing protein [Oceanospirillaceae bacterium]
MNNWTYLLVTIFVVFSVELTAEILVFNTSSTGYPPYLINSSQGDSSGIMVDVLEHVARKHNYIVKFVQVPKKRVEKRLDRGSIDASASAKEWVTAADKYIFSDVVLVVKDVLFSPINKPVDYTQASDLFGKRLGGCPRTD